MVKQKTEVQLCDFCEKVIGHLEDNSNLVLDRPHIMVVFIEGICYKDIGKQHTFDFCNMKCMRKFFKNDDYKKYLKPFGEDQDGPEESIVRQLDS